MTDEAIEAAARAMAKLEDGDDHFWLSWIDDARAALGDTK